MSTPKRPGLSPAKKNSFPGDFRLDFKEDTENVKLKHFLLTNPGDVKGLLLLPLED